MLFIFLAFLLCYVPKIDKGNVISSVANANEMIQMTALSILSILSGQWETAKQFIYCVVATVYFIVLSPASLSIRACIPIIRFGSRCTMLIEKEEPLDVCIVVAHLFSSGCLCAVRAVEMAQRGKMYRRNDSKRLATHTCFHTRLILLCSLAGNRSCYCCSVRTMRRGRDKHSHTHTHAGPYLNSCVFACFIDSFVLVIFERQRTRPTVCSF